jgi:hypothetical protein
LLIKYHENKSDLTKNYEDKTKTKITARKNKIYTNAVKMKKPKATMKTKQKTKYRSEIKQNVC